LKLQSYRGEKPRLEPPSISNKIARAGPEGHLYCQDAMAIDRPTLPDARQLHELHHPMDSFNGTSS